ncbi:MAG: NADH-quinone oxidoreductase subunit H, partial [Candidatus Taylorbacteria bacterium]|nr:NADH-quinone oxidoreductase subunit H [Candidatus Taylorbacteria bacterium]
MSLTISWIIQMLLIPVLSPLFIGITRKVKAKFQNRTGATIFQPYKDFWKLFHKDEVVSLDASWIFLFVPYIIFALTILIRASIPLIPSLLISN